MLPRCPSALGVLLLSGLLGCDPTPGDDGDPADAPPELPSVAEACATVDGPAVRRLSVPELHRALSELLEVDTDPLHDLPADDQVAGFTTVAEGLPITPLFVQRLHDALADLLAARLPDPPPPAEPLQRWEIEDRAVGGGLEMSLADRPDNRWWMIWDDDPVQIPFTVDTPGEGALTLRTQWTFGAHAYPEPSGPPHLALSLDGVAVAEDVTVLGVEPDATTLTLPADLAAGEHTLTLTLTLTLLNPFPGSSPEPTHEGWLFTPEAMIVGLDRLDWTDGTEPPDGLHDEDRA